MSIWLDALPDGASLAGREGALVSVSISVDPRHLEALLEALARIDFPINPQIYHDAAMVYVFPDGQQRSEPVTLVEFPAYESRLEEVRRTLAAFHFDPQEVHVMQMLDELHTADANEPAPPGAAYVSRFRVKRRTAAAVQ